jgi:hypothetical protein
MAILLAFWVLGSMSGAEQTRDKQQMIDIAEKWRNMAAHEEKHAR